MVKKIVTGLALSLGAGVALAAVTRTTKKGPWHPVTADSNVTPVTIRVHTAVPRNEHMEMVVADRDMLPDFFQRSAELAEIKVMIESLDQRNNDILSTVNQRIDDLQNHLPRFIDVKVTARIRELEERLRSEFQDEQSKTLDAFLGTLETKILPRIALVESAVGSQGAEIGEIRQRIDKTDETLDRVLDRIGKVVDSMTPAAGYANGNVTKIHQKAVA